MSIIFPGMLVHEYWLWKLPEDGQGERKEKGIRQSNNKTSAGPQRTLNHAKKFWNIHLQQNK